MNMIKENNRKLEKEIYLGNAEDIAKFILGKILVHKSPEGITKGMIVETEAYLGEKDKGSHTYNNRRTKRTEIQYKEGGYAYVYFIYGMYYCFNIVTNKAEKAEAVLIRALEPVEGLELMKARRKNDNILKLANGPGKLCTAMGITREHNGMDLCSDILYLEYPENDVEHQIEASKRINIDYAEEAKDYLLRFTIKGNKYVSI